MLKLIPLIIIGVPVAISDFNYQRIPNRLLLVLWLSDEIFQFQCGWRFEWTSHLRAFSLLMVGLVFSILLENSIGMGDIKLFALLDLLLGKFSLSEQALVYAAIIALAYAIVARKRTVLRAREERPARSFAPDQR